MKKKKSPQRSQKQAEPADLSLPQNILLFGDQIQEDKRVYISQRAYKDIHYFTKDKTTNESGGVLLGNVIEEFGKIHIVIRGFIEAKYCEGTPTTLKFTHETWEYIHKEAARKFPEYKILGWIHTHPDFGIFLSEYDKFIHENFFSEENQVAYVVDPIQHIEGFYCWMNGKIERCSGFFVFDKPGTKITVGQDREEAPAGEPVRRETAPVWKTLIIALMGICLIALAVFCVSLYSRVNALQDQLESVQEQHSDLEKDMASFERTTNQNFITIDDWLEYLNSAVSELQTKVIGLEQPESGDTQLQESADPSAGTEPDASGVPDEQDAPVVSENQPEQENPAEDENKVAQDSPAAEGSRDAQDTAEAPENQEEPVIPAGQAEPDNRESQDDPSGLNPQENPAETDATEGSRT